MKRRVLSLLSALAATTLLSGCAELENFGHEKGLSSVNDSSLGLWNGAWLAAAVVGAFTLILILWPAVFHRANDAKKGEFPKQTQYHIPIEILYTIVPFIIVAVLFYFTAKTETEITAKTGTVQHEISVNAIQWSWQFGYPEAGEKAIVTGTPDNYPTLYLPVGERVRFTITASDVVHGFSIPAFMIQIQNIPGVTNNLELTANKVGDYKGLCYMHCGRDHSRMRFNVKVVTPDQYKQYLETLKVGA